MPIFKVKIEYLGYTLFSSGITLVLVILIQRFPQLKNMVEVQRFLGLTNYFRKFIKDYAKMTKLLQNLLYKSTLFNFDTSCLEVFKSLKEALTSFPVI